MNHPTTQLNEKLKLLERLSREQAHSLDHEELEHLDNECTRIGWITGNGRCHYLMGVHYKALGNIQEAQKYFAITNSIGLQLDDPQLLGYATYGFAMADFESSNLSEAYALTKEAERYARLCNDQILVTSCNSLEAYIKNRYGEHDAAIIMLQTALHLANQYAPELVGDILQNIVEIHLINGEFLQAREYASTYLTLYSTHGQIQKRLQALIRLATIEVELSEIKSAQRLLNEAQDLLVSQDSTIYATMLCLFGIIATKKKKYQIGLQHYEKAAALYRKFQKPRLESNAMGFACKTYLMTKDIPNAVRYASKALKLAKEAEDRYMTKESLQLLHEAHKASKDIEKSLKYLEEYNKLAQQDAVKQFDNRLAFVNLKTEYEKKHAEAEEARRRAEALRIELETKEHDLTERTRNLIKQTEAMAKLRDDLRAIIKSNPNNAIAKQINERLRMLPDEHSNWSEFEKHFVSVHPDFEKKLFERFPMLTKMERKICILLRLNLMSIDMAKLLILSERNIENHRHRLRKKLALGSEVNLQEFLSTIT